MQNRIPPLAASLALVLVSSPFLASTMHASWPQAGDRNHGSSGSRAYLHSFNLAAHGVALDGYSPVSYFDGQAERGDPLFAVEHAGVTYHLADASQVTRFRAAPERFLPAFGGWCAFGMAVQDKFPVDPRSFKIVDGRLLLYLRNAGVDARALWDGKDEKNLMEKARAHWAKVKG